jgi:hypothetical protein
VEASKEKTPHTVADSLLHSFNATIATLGEKYIKIVKYSVNEKRREEKRREFYHNLFSPFGSAHTSSARDAPYRAGFYT